MLYFAPISLRFEFLKKSKCFLLPSFRRLPPLPCPPLFQRQILHFHQHKNKRHHSFVLSFVRSFVNANLYPFKRKRRFSSFLQNPSSSGRGRRRKIGCTFPLFFARESKKKKQFFAACIMLCFANLVARLSSHSPMIDEKLA